jgi:hypothetical protein
MKHFKNYNIPLEKNSLCLLIFFSFCYIPRFNGSTLPLLSVPVCGFVHCKKMMDGSSESLHQKITSPKSVPKFLMASDIFVNTTSIFCSETEYQQLGTKYGFSASLP